MGRLEGKIAVVTSANSGIGYATAKLFDKQVVRLFVTGRRSVKFDAVVQVLGDRATGVAGDIAKLLVAATPIPQRN